MSEMSVDVKNIRTVWGDRVLVKRLSEPEKKRGLFVPQTYAQKKEPRKVWWAEVVDFGAESRLAEDHRVAVGDVVGVEPLGHHYATFIGEDGHTYVWVPDEHFCLADTGSVADYYADKLDRKLETPQLRLLGDRLLLRATPEDPKKSRIVRPVDNAEREAKVADVVLVGALDDAAGRPSVKVGDRVVHVAEDGGASAMLDIFDPPLTVLRAADLIATMQPDEVPA